MSLTLYKGQFNYHQTPLNLYTHAKNKNSAYWNFINQISKKFGLSKGQVISEFSGLKDNYLITEEG